MKKRLIITEGQLERLKLSINETAHASIVKQMKTELDANYEVANKFVRQGGDYSDKLIIQNKLDEEIITPEDLSAYLKHKYTVGSKFINQVIKDWVDGKITDDFRLSKNIALN